MKVYIANFGQENYEWPECLDKSTVATMNDIEAQPLWEQGKREQYITERMKSLTAAGKKPTRPVAARWYNLMTFISQTDGDVWIHRDGEKLYWTISKSSPPFFTRKVEPVGRKREVVVCHKPCEAWSSRSRSGNELLWRSLHPKARDFLSTEATLQQLNQDYASYALALINGKDLAPWHEQSAWQEKNKKSAREYSPVTNASNTRKVACRLSVEQRMSNTAKKTARNSNGQTRDATIKNKEFRFTSELELEEHIISLIERQNGYCTLTGLPLEMNESNGDSEFFCSLDRIDSDGHYEAGNLQVVCRFANRWKGASDDGEFRRIIKIIQEYSEHLDCNRSVDC
ncbi:hypothetical protein J6I90_12265 [Pseudidiomarina sp. 1APP75-32.1]|uniref:HNH endonuclease n=1 Tax=Pseudidiomarina terrestris TaxID=2820060 RepID=A0AAW7R3W7_9GAMM|nr:MULTISPECIES: hypothetical protein [unclassified Pseudidiomarina]MDN7125657.1 hypothetical protein [Pseudidiomarina sp. 1APP75-32.1]MDN7130479.1 hypothetical protein [Pseudidiomarina sp. 1APR75-15]